jgi:hypothetical protein
MKDYKDRPQTYNMKDDINSLLIAFVKLSSIGLAIIFAVVYLLEYLAGI